MSVGKDSGWRWFKASGVNFVLKVRRRDKDGRLKPLSMSARLSLLRAHGVHQVDREESAAIETIQVSVLLYSYSH